MNFYERFMLNSVSSEEMRDFIKANPEEAGTIISNLSTGSEDIYALRKRANRLFDAVVEEKKRNLTEDQHAQLIAWDEHFEQLALKNAYETIAKAKAKEAANAIAESEASAKSAETERSKRVRAPKTTN
jgi:hypothetical protein